MKKLKGFTMIELLVVIAIIGILAGIAVISFNSVQKKAKDKAIMSEMAQLRTQAGVFYDTNNTYTDLADDADITRIQTSITDEHSGAGFALTVSDDGESWAADVTMPGGDDYCVDSAGFSGEGSNTDDACVAAGGEEAAE